MTQPQLSATHLQLIQTEETVDKDPANLFKFMNLLGITDTPSSTWVEKLPFAMTDATAGTETELQTAEIGSRHIVDLPQCVETSSYFKNIAKRAATGDAPRKIISALEACLDSSEQTWENSWVRFPRGRLNAYAAADLHLLVTMLAYKYIFQHQVSHHSIPDSPTVESERRQFFFGAAIGLPTLYVARKSPNQLMAKIIKIARNTRSSRRYSGYVRITGIEYRRALLRLLREDTAALIEMMQLQPVIDNLQQRIDDPEQHAVDQRLTRRILEAKAEVDPLKVRGQEFNRRAEAYYRQDLRQSHIKEAFAHFRKAVKALDSWPAWRSGQYNQALLSILGGKNSEDYLAAAERAAVNETLFAEVCEKLIGLLLLVFDHDKNTAAGN